MHLTYKKSKINKSIILKTSLLAIKEKVNRVVIQNFQKVRKQAHTTMEEQCLRQNTSLEYKVETNRDVYFKGKRNSRKRKNKIIR